MSTFTESHKTGKQRHLVTEQQRKTVIYKQQSTYLISGVLLQYEDLVKCLCQKNMKILTALL
jgi:hypothetical protein